MSFLVSHKDAIYIIFLVIALVIQGYTLFVLDKGEKKSFIMIFLSSLRYSWPFFAASIGMAFLVP
ncbi:hypothetical protein GHT89_16540 [Acinetobacter baumannii]|uniref:hypothetical protein n=1 Tax=Acinetobacter baumannii TaxID=470 RepID=UPI00387DC41A